MFNRKKSTKFVALTLLASLLLIAAFMASVNAQGTATVNILASVGGTTNPGTGTQNPADGTALSLTATPDSGYEFQTWVISSSTGDSTTDLSQTTTITVTGGVTYTVQAVFQPIQAPPGTTQSPLQLTTDAVVGVLASAGGTTNPKAGVYYLASATQLKLTATASSGWEFSHWVISGPNLSHGGYPYTAVPTDNPYTVDHGYGNRFDYQAVFVPVGTTVATPTPTSSGGMAGISSDTAIIIGLVVVIVIILIAFGVFASRRKK